MRELPVKGRQQPMAVQTGMPVETAEEDRMQRAWRLRVGGAVQYVIKLVGIFACDMAERNGGKARCQFGRDSVRHLRNTSTYISTALAAKSHSAVGAWTLITAL